MDYRSQFWNSNEVVNELTMMFPQDYWIEFFGFLENKKTKRVLDMGCGGGRYTEMLCKLGFQVTAFDLYDSMLQATTQRLKAAGFKAKVIKADMTELPFDDMEFDILLSNGLFHNATSKKILDEAVSESARVLKRQGLLCLNMFYDSGRNTKVIRVAGEVFITRENLSMTLLKKKALLSLLEKYSLISASGISFYDRAMSVGTRSVLRGVFIKT